MFIKSVLVAVTIAAASITAPVQPASAQLNCNVLPHGQGRANRYGREAQIYRQQSQAYNDIANQQMRQHQQVGQALRQAPIFGRYVAPAWNTPRYIYNGYNRYRGR